MSENQQFTGIESRRKIEQSCLVGRTEYKTRQNKDARRVKRWLTWSRDGWLRVWGLRLRGKEEVSASGWNSARKKERDPHASNVSASTSVYAMSLRVQ